MGYVGIMENKTETTSECLGLSGEVQCSGSCTSCMNPGTLHHGNHGIVVYYTKSCRIFVSTVRRTHVI